MRASVALRGRSQTRNVACSAEHHLQKPESLQAEDRGRYGPSCREPQRRAKPRMMWRENWARVPGLEQPMVGQAANISNSAYEPSPQSIPPWRVEETYNLRAGQQAKLEG